MAEELRVEKEKGRRLREKFMTLDRNSRALHERSIKQEETIRELKHMLRQRHGNDDFENPGFFSQQAE